MSHIRSLNGETGRRPEQRASEIGGNKWTSTALELQPQFSKPTIVDDQTAQGGTVAKIKVKRVHEPPHRNDGARILVDRLWPRGLKKDAAQITLWARDAAPSDTLRRWFRHDPKRWKEFEQRYWAELKTRPEAWQPIVDAARQGPVTLLYAARDQEHNNAVALASFLKTKTQ